MSTSQPSQKARNACNLKEEKKNTKKDMFLNEIY